MESVGFRQERKTARSVENVPKLRELSLTERVKRFMLKRLNERWR
jgi:hypothetical protein